MHQATFGVCVCGGSLRQLSKEISGLQTPTGNQGSIMALVSTTGTKPEVSLSRGPQHPHPPSVKWD